MEKPMGTVIFAVGVVNMLKKKRDRLSTFFDKMTWIQFIDESRTLQNLPDRIMNAH
jgi:hypothetical protein